MAFSAMYAAISCSEIAVGASSATAGRNKTDPGCWDSKFPDNKTDAYAWGKTRKMWGVAQICAAVACTGGVIGGVGGGTGNWAAAIGGASGLFFGLAGSGISMIYNGNRAIEYSGQYSGLEP